MRLAVYLCSWLVCGSLPAFAQQAAEPSPATPANESAAVRMPEAFSAPPGTTSNQPSSATATAPTGTPAVSSAATPPAAAASLAHSSSSASPTDLTDVEKHLIASGYKLQVKDGKKTFCRREVVLGSHFEKKVCGTADQLAEARQTGRDVTEMTQRAIAITPPGH